VLPASRTRILELVAPDAEVLDVGGWAKPLARADWVIDMMPYETRGLYGERDPEPERFSEETWVRLDICAREPWPFEDGRFDFAVCSHTLEDVRDPIWVCSELARVAKAGYVEVPSRLEEQSMDVHGPGWAGWSHHHWLIDVDEGGLLFVFKPHVLHADPRFHFPAWFGVALRPEERVQTLFWSNRLPAEERVFTDAPGLDDYLQSFVEHNRHLCDERRTARRRIWARRPRRTHT
jgi:hypothetical protein